MSAARTVLIASVAGIAGGVCGACVASMFVDVKAWTAPATLASFVLLVLLVGVFQRER